MNMNDDSVDQSYILPTPPPAANQSTSSGLAKLPDELLQSVLRELAIDKTPKAIRLNYLLTCRRWAAILEPQLFNDVTLLYTNYVNDARINEFRIFLLQKPHLRKHVLRLHVYIDKISDWFCQQVMTQIVEWCPNIQSFHLQMNMEDFVLPPLYQKAIKQQAMSMLMNATTKLKSIEELDLFKIPFGTVIRAVEQSSARKLRLKSPSWDVNSFGLASARYGDRDNLSNDRKQKGLPESPLKSRAVKDVQITDAVLFASDILVFLQWFPGLEVLSLDYNPVDNHHCMSSDQWFELLEPHSSSMTSLSFPLRVFHNPSDCLKFSDKGAHHRHLLPELETLRVTSFYQLFDSPYGYPDPEQQTRSKITNMILGSKIKKLYLVFNEESDSMKLLFWEFTRRKMVLWFQQFVLLLKEEQQQQQQSLRVGMTHHSLELIRLQDWRPLDGEEFQVQSISLDPVRNQLSELGIQLECVGRDV